jgi:hypothetical protein
MPRKSVTIWAGGPAIPALIGLRAAIDRALAAV